MRSTVLVVSAGPWLRSQIFTALVSCDDEKPFRPGCPRLLATLRLAGDDVTDYLSIGDHFDLWLGNTVGDGLVTRRLFAWPSGGPHRGRTIYHPTYPPVYLAHDEARIAHVFPPP